MERIHGRGTGRTYRAVEATPDGGTYIVSRPENIAYIRRMLVTQGRKTNCIRILHTQMYSEVYKGISNVVFDHDIPVSWVNKHFYEGSHDA